MCGLKDFYYTVVSEGIIAPVVSMWMRKGWEADGTCLRPKRSWIGKKKTYQGNIRYIIWWGLLKWWGSGFVPFFSSSLPRCLFSCSLQMCGGVAGSCALILCPPPPTQSPWASLKLLSWKSSTTHFSSVLSLRLTLLSIPPSWSVFSPCTKPIYFNFPALIPLAY